MENVTTKYCKKNCRKMSWPYIGNNHVNSKHSPAVILLDPVRNHIDPILSKTVDMLKAIY